MQYEIDAYNDVMKKLSIICLKGYESFLGWTTPLEKEYDIRRVISGQDRKAIEDAADWGDIVWLEWCNETAICATNYLFYKHGQTSVPEKKIIIRLHSFEAFFGYIDKIAWPVVDRLVFVSPHIRGIAYAYNDLPRSVATEVIPNGIDLDNTPQLDPDPGFNIAMVSRISHKKGPMLAIQVLKKLTDADKRYTLHWAGNVQEPRYDIYLNYMAENMGIKENLVFHGHLDNMDAFWKEQNFLLSTSPHESFGYGIFEAAARGVRPVVHNFYGAKDIYPHEWLFNTPEEAAELITSPKPLSRPLRQELIERKYTLKDQVSSIRQMLENV